jgi:UDP-N-acetylglucosamine 1-carboxyvinyltransferase
LVKMGAEIEGIGTSIVTINGKKELHGAKHSVISDRIEMGTYMVAAAITRGHVKLMRANYEIVENIALKLMETGVQIVYEGDSIDVRAPERVMAVNIDTNPYPGFATDLQAQFMALMTVASGASTITENIFENRFMHVPELCRMGANITINGASAHVRGVKKLIGAEVMASDLRASVSLVLAGLVADGETKIRRVYHIDRGYNDVVSKLAKCGAQIERVQGDSV